MANIHLAQRIGIDVAGDLPQALYISQDLNYFLVSDPKYWAQTVVAFGSKFKRLSLFMWQALQEQCPNEVKEINDIIKAHPHIVQ